MRSVQWKLKFGEARLVFWFKEVVPNAQTWGGDVWDEYLAGPYRRHDPIQMITGPVMAAASLLVQAPDQFIAGVLDQKLQPPSGPLGNIRQDTKLLVENVTDVRPLAAVATAVRSIGGAGMDMGDMAFGFHQAA